MRAWIGLILLIFSTNSFSKDVIVDVATSRHLNFPGFESICYLLSNGKVNCLGDYTGTLNGPKGDYPALKSISVTTNVGCGLQDDGKLHCWGIDADFPPKDHPALKLFQINYGGGCGVTLDDKVYCWNSTEGYYLDLEVRLANYISINSNRSPCVIGSNGLKCDDRSRWYYNMPKLDNPKEVVTAKDHACAIDGIKVVCWGSAGGAENVPQNMNFIAPKNLSLGVAHSCVLDMGKVKCWGSNVHGQLDVPAVSRAFKKITSTGNSICATDGQKLMCWGEENYLTSYENNLFRISNNKQSFVSSSGKHLIVIEELERDALGLHYEISIYNFQTKTLVSRRIYELDERIEGCYDIHPNGKVLFFCTKMNYKYGARILRAFNNETGRNLFRHPVIRSPGRGFILDGSRIAFKWRDIFGHVHLDVVNSEDFRRVFHKVLKRQDVLQFGLIDNHVYLGSYVCGDNEVEVWDINTRKLVQKKAIPFCEQYGKNDFKHFFITPNDLLMTKPKSIWDQGSEAKLFSIDEGNFVLKRDYIGDNLSAIIGTYVDKVSKRIYFETIVDFDRSRITGKHCFYRVDTSLLKIEKDVCSPDLLLGDFLLIDDKIIHVLKTDSETVYREVRGE